MTGQLRPHPERQMQNVILKQGHVLVKYWSTGIGEHFEMPGQYLIYPGPAYARILRTAFQLLKFKTFYMFFWLDSCKCVSTTVHASK